MWPRSIDEYEAANLVSLELDTAFEQALQCANAAAMNLNPVEGGENYEDEDTAEHVQLLLTEDSRESSTVALGCTSRNTAGRDSWAIYAQSAAARHSNRSSVLHSQACCRAYRRAEAIDSFFLSSAL
jgi:hypothetical protein